MEVRERFAPTVIIGVRPDLNNKGKVVVTIVVLGHVDSGKSTLNGVLKYERGDVSERELQMLEELARSMQKSKEFKWTLFTDTNKEEMTKGVTINHNMIRWKTGKYLVNCIDAPGHRDYVNNATTGAQGADITVLVCPARFETSVSSSGTLWTHLCISFALTESRKMIFLVSKMDEIERENPDNCKTAFEAARAALNAMVGKLGIPPSMIMVIPISAIRKIGLFNGGEQYAFFEGAPIPGKDGERAFNLEQAIEGIELSVRPVNKPLRLSINSVLTLPGLGQVFTGRVASGTLKKSQKVKLLPSGIVTEVKTIEEHRTALDAAEAGRSIGFTLTLKDKTQIAKIQAGEAVGPVDDPAFVLYNYSLVSAVDIKETKTKGSDQGLISAGYCPVFTHGSATVPVRILKLVSSHSRKSGETENPETVSYGTRFTAIVATVKSIYFDKAGDSYLARFIAKDGNRGVCVGSVVRRLTEEELAEFGVDINLAHGEKKALRELKSKKNKN